MTREAFRITFLYFFLRTKNNEILTKNLERISKFIELILLSAPI